MRRKHIIVCMVLSSGAIAAAHAENLHPTLGKTPPLNLTNKMVLDLPERERTAFVHGAVAGAAQALTGRDARLSQCLIEWYFGSGDGMAAIPQAMRYYPDMPVSATIVGLAEKVCEGK